MKVRYSYLKQQFSNCPELWFKLKKFVDTGDFTLGKPLKEFDTALIFLGLISTSIIVIG